MTKRKKQKNKKGGLYDLGLKGAVYDNESDGPTPRRLTESDYSNGSDYSVRQPLATNCR
jgi:hypothetical protein